MKSQSTIDTQIQFDDFSLGRQFFVALIILILLCVGQFFIPLWQIVLGLIGISLSYFILRNDLYTLLSYIGIIIAVKIRARTEEISPIDIAAGMLMTGILFSLILKKILFPARSLAPHSTFYFVLLFASWTLGIGLISIFNGVTTFNSWYREFLTFSPLIFIPVLFNSITEQQEKAFKILIKFFLALWITEQIFAVMLIKQSMKAAVFLYQTGRANFDVAGNSVMIFIFLSLSFADTQIKNRKYYIVGILISMVGLLLTFNRTGWVITIGLTLFMLFLTPKLQKKNRNAVILRLLVILILGINIFLFFYPIINLLIKWSLFKFLTSSNLKTDASLYNRYVEWRYVWQQILSTPFTGTGFGGKFKDYIWITGVTIDSFYTHSGFFGILLKSGIVGFILIFTAYIKFFSLGIKLLYNKILNDKEIALVRAGLFIILLITFHMFTLNPFMHREILLYLGLVWAYYIYLERKTKKYFLKPLVVND